MATMTTKDTRPGAIKHQLSDILVNISWGKLSQEYFSRSASWLYHKMDGIDGNGKEFDFTEQERETFRQALLDLSDRIRRTAEKI